MKKTLSRYFSAILVLCMILSMCTFTAIAKDETAALAEDAVYYVQHNATGNGLTIETPGSFATVVAAINEKYGSGDTVTIKIVKGAWDDVASATSAQLPEVYHASMADIPEHEATIILTSADTANPSRLAYSNIYESVNDKGSNIALTGPTVFKDIKLIDTRINHHWEIYQVGNDLTIDSGATWYRATYNSTDGVYKFEGTVYPGSINLGARSTKTYNSPVTFTLADGAFSNFSSYTYSGYNTSGVMTFNEDATMRFGAATINSIFVDDMNGTYALFKKNVNLVLNGTTVNKLANRSGKTEAQLPVIEGAFQIIRNNGATATNNVTGFKDAGRTTACDIYDITVETGAVLDVTSVAGKYSVNSSSVVYAQSEDRKTAWYSKDGYITITKPGTYTVKTAASVDEIKAALAIPAASSLYVFDDWSDNGNGTITANIAGANGVYYVSASGSDTNTGKSASAPFATIKKAMESIGSTEGTIIIVGSYSPTRTDYISHTQNINIIGHDETSKFDSSLAPVSFGGPVTIKNITYTRGTNSYILSKGEDITFGEGFSTTSTDDWMVFGMGSGSTYVNDINVTVKSGNFTGKFNVGGIMPSSSGYTVNNDANINVSGGSISNIILGSTSWGACGATNFAKSVVVQHDGGIISSISATATGNGSPTKITGSLIVINNNGAAAPTYDTSLDSISIGSKYYINAPEGAYITPVVDADGNAVAGKFHVTIDDSTLSAVFTNELGKVVASTSGEVTLFTGVTNVALTDSAFAEDAYYVSASGSDDNDGLSYLTPFATMKKAFTEIGNDDGIVYIIGAYSPTSADAVSHTGNITIEGFDATASVDSSLVALSFGGPVTLQNIKYIRGTNSYILSRGHDITFGEGFRTTSTDDWMVFGNGQNSSSVNDINVNVLSGNFTGKFNVGGIMPSTSGYTVNNDANINVSGGSIANIILGSTNWGACGATNFAKSVVLQHDGGTVTKITATATGNGSPTKITGSLIVINNNGSTAPTYDTSLDSISVGSKYYINSGEGGYVKPVVDADGNAVQGKFHITIDDDANESAMIVNGDSRTFISESGEITLQEGTTEITYANYPPNPGTTIPMTWKEMDKGYITLIFDDVRADFPTIFEIVSKEYNLPLCAAVPSNNIKNAPEVLHELQDRGGEILSHTKSHLVIKPFITPWADVETQLGDSYKILTQEGFNVNGIILAGGTGQIGVGDTEYRGLIELITNKYYKYSDKYGLSTQYWKQRNWFSGRTLDQLKSIVDTQAANKTWEVIYGHDLTEVSEENLRAFCEYLIEQQNQGKIKVVTYKYMHENFGDWESPVDFGDTTYTVEFYGTDHTTLVEKQVIVEGENATAPTSFSLAEGYTLESWDGNLENVDNNRKVYAVCKDSQGNTVGTDVDSVITPPPYVAPTLFYIDSTNGLDTNDGETASTALASLNKAIEIAESDKPFEVKIIGSYQLPSTLDAHAGMLTISGYDSTSEIYTVQSGGYTIKGDITLKNIKFTNGLYAWVSLCGNKFVIGENVTISGSHQIVLGGNSGTKATTGYADIASGTWNKLVLGPIAAGDGHSTTSDVKVYQNGGTINNLVLGSDGWSASHKGVTFGKNVLFKHDGGTVKTIKTFTNNYTPTFNGSIQLIFNNGTKPQSIDATVSSAASAGQYYVYSNEGGYVDFVYNTDGSSKTGVFKITPNEGKYAVIENGDNKKYVYTESEVTLETGTTNITYGDASELDTVIKVDNGTKEYVFGIEDSVTLSVGGKVSFPENIEKSGYIFGGWYSDSAFTTPVANRSSIAQGTTVYAKWIKLSEKDLFVEGVQIRFADPTGLRFVTNITHDTRSAIVALNSANTALDPENEAFNTTDGISYGSVVVPAAPLGDEKLEKSGVYTYNNKDYAAKTVPAKNTFEVLDGYDRYTAVIINIPDSNLSTDYTVRPYITYTDASGMTRTLYGKQYAANIYEVATIVYEDDASEYPEENRESILSYLYESILTKNDGINNSLANTYRALKLDKKLTIGYIGGSITYGSSAAKLVNEDGTVSSTGGNINDSYVNRTTAWFEESFPEADIEFINAGISDTATNFGIYRLEDHLMNTNGHDMPDLVFVEFTSNDWTYDDGISQDASDLFRQAESIVRNIYSHNPYADIVFVFTARSLTNSSRVQYVKVAEEYGIPYVDMGVPMQALMTERGASNEASGTYYYTVDNLHPSAKGYEVYFGEIEKLLKAELIDSKVYYTEKCNYSENIPEQLNRSLWLNPQIIPASEFTVSGSVSSGSGLTSDMYGTSKTTSSATAVTADSIVVTGTDATAEFTFTGTSFGLIFGMNSSGFDIDYQIDGHGWKKAEVDEDLLSFQKYSHTQLIVFEQELAYGEHTIELKFNATSDGNVNVRIGGAAVSGVDNGLQKIFALTIDDGPKVVASNQILDVLTKYGAHATFFVVGTSCNDSTKEVLNRMLESDCEIGNHSNRWTGIAELTAEEVLADYNACQTKVYSLTGYYPTIYRAPGLSMSETAFATIPVPVMGGYSIGTDWEASYTYEQRLSALRSAIGDGRVVLIHDQEANVAVLETVIPEVLEDGYKIVTASELIKLRGYGIAPYTKTQYKEFAK